MSVIFKMPHQHFKLTFSLNLPVRVILPKMMLYCTFNQCLRTLVAKENNSKPGKHKISNLLTCIYVHTYMYSIYIRYASKRMQPICKICVPRFDKKCATLLCFASGFVRKRGIRYYGIFLPNVPQFGKTHRIFTGKVLQSVLSKMAHFQD